LATIEPYLHIFDGSLVSNENPDNGNTEPNLHIAEESQVSNEDPENGGINPVCNQNQNNECTNPVIQYVWYMEKYLASWQTEKLLHYLDRKWNGKFFSSHGKNH